MMVHIVVKPALDAAGPDDDSYCGQAMVEQDR